MAPVRAYASGMRSQPVRYFPIDDRRDAGGALVYPMPGPFEPLRARADRNGAVDGQHFQVDAQLDHYRGRKAELLSDPDSAGPRCLRLEDHDAQLGRARSWMVETLQREHPGLLDAAQHPTLDGIARAIQEDIVVMARPSDKDADAARAAYVNVCFPSGWRPAAILGKDFTQIHTPVPAHDRFGASRRALADTLFGTTRVRYVWTVTPNDELDRHPDSTQLGDWTSTARAFLRVERQVIAPLDDVSVFLIRVYSYAVDELSPSQRAQLSTAVAEMPATIARYKGLLAARPHITPLLAR